MNERAWWLEAASSQNLRVSGSGTVVKPYRIIYRIEEDTVTVLAVLDGRRDLEDLLLERLIRG